MGDETRTAERFGSRAHPGEMVVDYLEFNNWSQRDLARRTGITPKTISEICNGKASITPQTALALEKVLQRPAHFWLNLQRHYDEKEARRRVESQFSEWGEWARRFPLSEMKRYKLLDATQNGDFLVEALLRFFGVSSPEGWRSVCEASHVAYRQTRRFVTSMEAISAWIRATEVEASRLETMEFDEASLRAAIPHLRQQTKESPDRFVPRVQELCARAGVAVVWVPELSGTGISGCARWLSARKALIGLTLRYKTDDQMWFTFFHEIAHLLLHRKQHAFILDNAEKDLGDMVVDPQMQKHEEEANRYAADTLIPPTALADFLKTPETSCAEVLKFAKHLDISPGIVVGRLQREGVLAYNHCNALKRRLEWSLKRD
jgi:addiction module HigA family antidote